MKSLQFSLTLHSNDSLVFVTFSPWKVCKYGVISGPYFLYSDNKQIMRKHQCGTTSKWWRSVVAVSNDSQVSFANSFLHLNKFWASPMWFNLTVLSANILSFSQNLINSTVVNTQIAHINLCPKVLRRLFKAWLQEVQFLLLSATELFQYSAGHPLMIFLVSIGKEVVCL